MSRRTKQEDVMVSGGFIRSGAKLGVVWRSIMVGKQIWRYHHLFFATILQGSKPIKLL